MAEGRVENLKPLNARTEEEQREMRIAAGRASGEARRKKRDMRKQAEILLGMKVDGKQKTLKAVMNNLGIKESDMTYSMGILASMIIEAGKGNVKAAQFLRDTAGYVPEQKLDIDANAKVESDVIIYLPDNGRDVDEEERDE